MYKRNYRNHHQHQPSSKFSSQNKRQSLKFKIQGFIREALKANDETAKPIFCHSFQVIIVIENLLVVFSKNNKEREDQMRVSKHITCNCLVISDTAKVSINIIQHAFSFHLFVSVLLLKSLSKQITY